MVDHEIVIEGVDLQGRTYGSPALLQMNHEDFPRRFLYDLAKMPHSGTQLSSAKTMTGSITSPATVYQPVQRILHLAAVQLACDSLLQPRLDPVRVESSGVVIRRLARGLNGIGFSATARQGWMKTTDGKFQWQTLADELADPEPARRPALQSGQAWLDTQLAASTLAQAATEVFTPAFLAPPAMNAALGRTIAYAVIPSASSDISDAKQGVPAYGADKLVAMLPNLLSATSGTAAPAPGASADYRWLSEEYAATQGNNAGFSSFSAALMMLFRQFNAFDGSADGEAMLSIYNRRNVTFESSNTTKLKGDFFSEAYEKLIDFDPASSAPPPTLVMPDSWEPLAQQDQNDLLPIMGKVLARLSSTVQPPEGRFQNPDRLYVARVFFRIKGHSPACPSVIYWSEPTAIFKIAAWYDSTQRPAAPIPLPDPTLRSFLKGVKPNVSFAVPDGLMAAMQGTSLKKLSDGQGGGKKLGLNWICGFNIPLITICAFFVLNIFLTLLNIVFFWLPFIKICIPFPVSEPASGDD